MSDTIITRSPFALRALSAASGALTEVPPPPTDDSRSAFVRTLSRDVRRSRDRLVESQDLRRRVAPDEGGRDECRHIHAPDGRRRALALAGDRRAHRPRDIGAHVHLTLDRRDVRDREIQSVLERRAHGPRHDFVRAPTRREQLIRKHASPCHFGGVAQARRDPVRHPRLIEDPVPRKCVQVHARHLPGPSSCDVGPLAPG
ncbi:MAG TPA: hypothetical protein VH458_03950, partial [Vicinamibacterales bacterium]